MTEAIKNEFQPDYVSLPGDTLSEILEERGMSQATLAERTGRSKKTINEIIKGKAPITHETALHLERVLGLPAAFWITRENQYREGLARLKERERLKEDIDFLKEVPCSALKKMGWLPPIKDKVDLLEAVLRFFGVASVKDCRNYWQGLAPAFRRSKVFKGDPASVYAWLRMGEIEAQKIDCRNFNKVKFRGAVKTIREEFVRQEDGFQHDLIEVCAQAGVALVFLPRPPRTPVSGASRWLSPHRALIQLSLRFKRDDQLWFSFFHEAGHLLQHTKELRIVVNGENHDIEEENEANEFAANILIPNKEYSRFTARGRPTKNDVIEFAKTLNITPGIVVGRLQHEKILKYNYFNDLKVRFEWAN